MAAAEEFLGSDMGMSIDDNEFIELFEQSPWESLPKDRNKEDPPLENNNRSEQLLETIEDMNVTEEEDTNEQEPMSDLGNLPDFPEISIDDLPVFPQQLLSKWGTEDRQEDKPDDKPPTAPTNRSFRQRNAIQLNPFTVEYARYKNMLSRLKLRPSSRHDTPSFDNDESIYSQYVPPSTETRKRTSAPSSSSKAKSTVRQELPEVTKYGLDKLILPSTLLEEKEDKGKNKVVTFKKKRKHQRMNGSRKIPRLQEPKDIFAFEDHPQSHKAEDDEDDEDWHLHFRKMKKAHTLIDSGSESEDHEEELATEEQPLTEEQLDRIFEFPRHLPQDDQTKRLERKITDDDVVPVIADEYEFRERKRPRMKFRDIEKQKALRSVLPRSFLKVYEKEILEEANRRKQKKRAKPHPSVTEEEKTEKRSIDDVFAGFRDSQESTLPSSSVSLDDYVVRNTVHTREESTVRRKSNNHREESSVQRKKTSHLLEEQRNDTERTTGIYTKTYPLHEAMEYNRIRTLYSHQSQKTTKKTPRTHKSGKKTVSRNNKISCDDPTQSLFDDMEDEFQDNEPFQETSYDDLYDDAEDETHPPIEEDFMAHNSHKKAPKGDKITAVNGSFTYYYKYPQHDIKPSRAENSKGVSYQQSPLETMMQKIRHACGYGVKATIDGSMYLHKRLLEPLLSHSKAYGHLENEYKELEFFNMHFLWTDVVPKEHKLMDALFYQMSRRVQGARWWEKESKDCGRFYTFVSICLTLWVPCLPEDERMPMIDLVMGHVRNAAWMVTRLVFEKPRDEVPWKTVVQLAIYILDWTCRLQQLGVYPLDWSVVDYSKMLLDVLIHSGDDKENGVVEAWICLIYVVSVSLRNNEFGLNEYVFLKQFHSSVKKSVIAAHGTENQEAEIKKCTEQWAESISEIIDRYIIV